MRCSGHRRRRLHRLESGRRAARARRRGDGRRRPLDRPPREPRRGAGGGRRAGRARHPRRRRAERAGGRASGPRRSSTWPPRSTSASRSTTPPSTPRSTSAAPPTCSRRPAPPARGRVVFVSTGGAIYGEGEGQQLPLDEDAPIAPLSAYGQSKFAGRGLPGALRAALRPLQRSRLRLGNVYGPRQDPLGEAGVIAIFCGLLRAGGRPTVFGDGTQTRDYIYVGDVVAAALAAADSEATGPINIGTGDRDRRARAGRGAAASSAAPRTSSPSSRRRAPARCSGSRSTPAAPSASWAGAPRPASTRACASPSTRSDARPPSRPRHPAHARPGLCRQGVRLPVPQGDLRPVLRAGHAGDARSTSPA